MIRIISDFSSLVKENGEIIVANVTDYINAYLRILDAFEKKADLSVYVQLPAVEYWFTQMAERYSGSIFSFEHIDARIYLQQLWGIQIPDTIVPEEIVKQVY